MVQTSWLEQLAAARMERVVRQGNKVRSVQDIGAVLDAARREGKVVSLCHGVFDLLHPGHFRHLRTAKGMADVLVVTITGKMNT